MCGREGVHPSLMFLQNILFAPGFLKRLLRQGFSSLGTIDLSGWLPLCCGASCSWDEVWQEPWPLPTRCQQHCPLPRCANKDSPSAPAENHCPNSWALGRRGRRWLCPVPSVPCILWGRGLRTSHLYQIRGVKETVGKWKSSTKWDLSCFHHAIHFIIPFRSIQKH